MHTLALICQKGGAGKTTLAIHLAAAAASAGHRTLLLDLDPQASARKWADRREAETPDTTVESPARLDAALKAAAAEGYGLTILDTAPNADQAALRAARLADLVLMPVRPSILDLDAAGSTIELCELAARPLRAVLNACPARSRVTEEAGAALQALGATLAQTIVHERVALRHALTGGQVAAEYEPGGRAAAEIAALYAEACQALGIKAPRRARSAA